MTITDPAPDQAPPVRRALTVGERAAAMVPEPIADAWRNRVTGPIMRAALVIIGIPLAITVLAGSVPVGVYLNGVIIGSLYALIAIGIILVYRANRIINFAQASLGAAPA